MTARQEVKRKPQRRFIDVVKEGMQMVGVTEKDNMGRVRCREMTNSTVFTPKGNSQKRKTF